METRPEENQRRSGGIAFPWVLVLMAASFVGGAFVGLHPSWLPFLPMSGGAPDTSTDTTTTTLHPVLTTQPAALPTTAPTTQTP